MQDIGITPQTDAAQPFILHLLSSNSCAASSTLLVVFMSPALLHHEKTAWTPFAVSHFGTWLEGHQVLPSSTGYAPQQEMSLHHLEPAPYNGIPRAKGCLAITWQQGLIYRMRFVLEVIAGPFFLCRIDVLLHYSSSWNPSGSLPGDRGGNTCLEVCFTHLLIENIFLTLCMLWLSQEFSCINLQWASCSVITIPLV